MVLNSTSETSSQGVAVLLLFDAFASEEKTLLAFPGSHFRVPAHRIDTGFFARTLR